MASSSTLKPELKASINAKLDAMIELFYRTVPGARHQLDAKDLDMAYYRRHSIETILRIRLKRSADALVIHYFTKHDPRQAKEWSKYTEEEMLHDTLFAKDLEHLGVPKDVIYATEPLLATKLLQGYFYFTLEHEGPMASLASAYFLEYVTKKTQPDWLDNLEKRLGKQKVNGARTHVNYDIDEDHSDFVWNVMMSVTKTEADEARLEKHLEAIFGLFCAYFTEVHTRFASDSAHARAGVAPVSAVAFAAAAAG